MNHLPKSWLIIRKAEHIVEIHVKQARDTKSVLIALGLAGLCLRAWLQGPVLPMFAEIDFPPFNVLLGWGIVCVIALPFAIAQVFLHETWLVAHNFLMVRKSLLWFKRERHFRNAHFEFVTHELESSYSWTLKVCSNQGEQKLFYSPTVAELDDVALLLSQRTGWPVHQ